MAGTGVRGLGIQVESDSTSLECLWQGKMKKKSKAKASEYILLVIRMNQTKGFVAKSQYNENKMRDVNRRRGRELKEFREGRYDREGSTPYKRRA